MKQRYQGSCHCGDVRFRAMLDLDDSIVCDCSICSKKASVICRTTDAEFELLTSPGKTSVYTFNTKIARHYFCPSCGIHPFHRPRSYPDLWGVNIRCLDDVNIDDLNPRAVRGSELD